MATGNSAVGVGGTSEANEYCRELVRKHDYEAYLSSYFYPRAAQPGYFALRAFNIELAMIRETVSRPIIGKMRMQFWRDAIKSITNDKPTKHPIAIALHEASQKAKLPPYYLKRMVDSRDEDLDRESHITLEGVTQYAESTSSTLLYLLLGLLHQSHSDTFAHAASHVGIAHSFATLLRALPFHATNRRMVIPAEITAKHGVRQEEVFRMGGDAHGIDDAVFEFATVANDHILTARDTFKNSRVPSEAMPAFLSAVPVVSFLSRLEQVNFDAFAPQLQTRSWKLPLSILRANITRKF
ncbi:NADH dehydrogenase (ubiquinone) complex I, assembly factor 6 OS=Bos taurus GN=NDUFAF6 PE=2 SV=1 [Rhizoctonia solani AG-1 IB]|uniref:NADH dehydrogenase (Ubiquinone) complex I, assembly factor 6 n=1 Tax=Thanatephorus cucumeris (strain AG1-IB / isolate 7/3/14) TaxID=1108050 RepID=A0A0B7FXN8_THACB|nr:NADH dehydrogenase (ubiquinone) complex I, assembly factor 6 OS=Bos taurus GN=NDUFAF6 PE=2 SV=1 [Rhizoctonia solani AG-1 IB]